VVRVTISSPLFAFIENALTRRRTLLHQHMAEDQPHERCTHALCRERALLFMRTGTLNDDSRGVRDFPSFLVLSSLDSDSRIEEEESENSALSYDTGVNDFSFTFLGQ
jgi:hypothetical protein